LPYRFFPEPRETEPERPPVFGRRSLESERLQERRARRRRALEIATATLALGAVAVWLLL
jgi:hypothetical protein